MRIDVSQGVHHTTKKNLEKIKGFSEVKVEKVKEAVKKCMVRPSAFFFDAFRRSRWELTRLSPVARS